MASFLFQSTALARRCSVRLGLLSVLCAVAAVPSVFADQFRTTHPVAGIATGDFNGDGIDDMVTCGSSDTASTINVLLGNGDGTFQRAIPTRVGPNPGAVAVGDFNLDGKLDVVTADFGTGDAPGRAIITVLFGNGDGTFPVGQNFFVNKVPNSVVVTDLNADGIPDFVVGNSTGFVTLLGNGLGSFTITDSVRTKRSSDTVTVGDIDGDGKVDVLQGNAVDSISIALGNGDGTFQAAMLGGPGQVVQAMLVGDLNGDGLNDLAGVLAYAPNNWSFFINSGFLQFYQQFDVGLSAPVEDFVAGDLNGDSTTDFAFSVAEPGGRSHLITAIGAGDGTFQIDSTPGGSPGDVLAVGHFNADTDLDLAGGVATAPVVIVQYGDGDGNFTSTPDL